MVFDDVDRRLVVHRRLRDGSDLLHDRHLVLLALIFLVFVTELIG